MPTEFQVRVTRRAKADIDEIWTFIAHDSVTEANRFIYQLEGQLKTLRRFPERCPLIKENESSDTSRPIDDTGICSMVSTAQYSSSPEESFVF